METNYQIGDIVFGKWTISRKIGEGSFGKVYEIQSEEFNHLNKSALKIITIPQTQGEVDDVMSDGMDENSATTYFSSIVDEIVKEFTFMSQLKGSGSVVSCEDVQLIQHQEKIGWDILIRMELLTPLMELMKTNTLSESDVIKLGIDICKALEICQQRNIIHRDVKPENIFVTDFNEYKLGDFGIARTLEKTTGGLSKKGTMIYMAPEVYRGEAYNSNVDIYSLGIVLYRLLNNNRVPFMPPFPEQITYGSREEALAKRMKGEKIPAPSQASEKMSNIILKACAFGSRERYANPSDLRFELEELLFESRRNKTIEPTVTEEVKVEKPVHETTPPIIPEPIEQNPISDEGTIGIFGTDVIFGKKGEDESSETILMPTGDNKDKREETDTVHIFTDATINTKQAPNSEIILLTKKSALKAPLIIGGVVILALAAALSQGNDNSPSATFTPNVALQEEASHTPTINSTATDNPVGFQNMEIEKPELIPGETVVEWTNSKIENFARGVLDKPTGDIQKQELDIITTITEEDLDFVQNIEDLKYFTSLVTLELPSSGIYDITSLAGLTNLEKLDLSDNVINDISVLSLLSKLKSLNLFGNNIVDINSLSKLYNLEELHLKGNDHIMDLSPLAELVNLKALSFMLFYSSEVDAVGNLINLEHLDYGSTSADISPLAELTNLTTLYIRCNAEDFSILSNLSNLTKLSITSNISDLKPISNLDKLEELELVFCDQVNDLTPVSEFSNLTSLNLAWTGVNDITPLSGLSNLTSLDLSSTGVNDITPLSGLSNLTSLDLFSTGVSNITPLSGLSKLASLDLAYTGVSDIAPLSGLDNLSSLYLSGTEITDISIISSFTNLSSLNLSGFEIVDFTPFANLTKLEKLDLSDNPGNHVSDLAPLGNLINLKELNLSSNYIHDLTFLGKLTNMEKLDLSYTGIGYIGDLYSLVMIEDLNLSGNNIEDISTLSRLTNLTDLALSYNNISDLSSLVGLTELVDLSIDDNQISSISNISDLIKLQSISISYNPINTIDALSNMSGLEYIRADYTYIEDLSPLSNLHGVTILDIGNTNVDDISLLSNFNNLYSLNINNIDVSDISMLSGLEKLEEFSAIDVPITDWSPVDHVEYVTGRP